MECGGLFDGFLEVGIAVGTQWTPTGAPRLVLAGEVHGGARRPCRHHVLVITMSSNERWRTERASVVAACVWMRLLKLRKAATAQGCKFDVLRGGMNQSTTWESSLHGGQGGLTGVHVGHLPEKDPRLSFLARVQHVVPCDRELQERRRGGPALLGRDVVCVLPPGLLRQDGVCPASVHDLRQHVQRATVYAEGDRECRGPPSCCPAAEVV